VQLIGGLEGALGWQSAANHKIGNNLRRFF
jgi:hypothetical protein